MIYTIFSLYLPILSLVLLTLSFVIRDRVLEKRIRRDFFAIFILLVIIFIWDSALICELIPNLSISLGLTMIRNLLQPFILCYWLDILLRDKSRLFLIKPIYIPLGINSVLAIICTASLIITGTQNPAIKWSSIFIATIIQIALAVMMTLAADKRSKRNNSSELKIVGTSILFILLAVLVECFDNESQISDIVIANVVCIYFFYIEIQVYKRDALTHLLTRHNLMNELKERRKEEFFVSLIDVDEFKKINDMYGHDKGDEALCQVVEALKDVFSENSNIYRYGGDEFVILSSNTTKEEIADRFAKVNELLDKYDRRVSYGCILHNPGEAAEDMLKQADIFMYEDKRNRKMEDIWDDITGTLNMKGFLEELDVIKKRADIERNGVILGAFDIERLGNINAEYGYSEGNYVIASLAEILRNSLDSGSILGHVGSDSFIVAIKTNADDMSPVQAFAERVNAGIVRSQKFDNKDYFVEVCEAHDLMDLSVKSSEQEVNRVIGLNRAEKEDRRKRSLSNDIDYVEMMVDKEEEEFALDIIDNNKFTYALQPIVSAKNGEIVAYEALMRSDTEPRMSPLTILRHAFKNNRGYDIEKATFFNVLKTFRSLKEKMKDRRMFLNSIPGYLLNEEDYGIIKEDYSDILSRVVVEITEQSELTDEELELIRKRQEELGNGIAIDDYGSGSSNTYNLLKIRPEVIKLDRLLISDIDTNTKKQYFVNSIVTFAKENGMQVLAEGVETEAEMKMVIRLHVDFIQGYYTAKPSFELIDEINPEIKKAIITENMRGISEGKRKIYLANNENYLSLVQIALEEYTGITVSSPKMILVGSRDYEADMNIKIKDGADVYLILRDVRLTSVDQLPCIDIGENAHLTLVLEGECSINHRGIHVPKGSRLDVLGSGDLEVSTKGHDCYGIGVGIEEEVGEICLNHSGMIKVRVDGELSAAIGGGVYSTGDGIQVVSGKLDISVASITGVGIGCAKGDMPIKLKDSNVNMEIRVNDGCGIGSLDGAQNIDISNFEIIFGGSGSRIAGIGTVNPSGGSIAFASGTLEGTMSGQNLYLVGAPEGEINIVGHNTKMAMKGEGNSVLGIGTLDKKSSISLEECTEDIIINAADPLAFGAEDEKISIKGVPPMLKVNA